MFRMPTCMEVEIHQDFPKCVIVSENEMDLKHPIDPYKQHIISNENGALFNMDNKNIDELVKSQNDILRRLKLVQQKCIDFGAKNNVTLTSSFDQNIIDEDNDDIKLDSQLDSHMDRLEKLKTNINTHAKSKALDLSSSPEMLELRLENILKCANQLQTQITAKLKSEGLSSSVSNTSQTTKNISLFADPSNPPISVLLLMKHMRDNGCQVAIVEYSHNDNYRSSNEIHEFIEQHLSLGDHRRDHCQVIVSLIWRKMELVGCISQMDVFNSQPMYGELMATYLLANTVCNIKLDDNVVDKIAKFQRLLCVQGYVKPAIDQIGVVMKSITNKTENSSCVKRISESFIFSCLLKNQDLWKEKASGNISKVFTDLQTRVGCGLKAV